MVMNSATGILYLLDEESSELKIHALQKLDDIVDLYWAEIADQISKIEILFEDEKFTHRNLAALVASKVYYHLGEYDEALTFALGAGPLFNLSDKTEFVETIIGKAIDKYIDTQNKKIHDKSIKIDPMLEDVLQRMFQRCFETKNFKQAAGISIECLRLDMLETSISNSDDPAGLLHYTLKATTDYTQHIHFKIQVLKLLVDLYKKLAVPDYLSIGQCLYHLNETSATADMLNTLSKGSEFEQLMAYQVAFDIEENATQEFSRKVIAALPVIPSRSTIGADANDSMQVDVSAPLLNNVTTLSTPLSKLHLILSGTLSIKLNLEFLFRNSKTDLLILKNTKTSFDSRNSAHHSSITLANAFQNAGTTSDEFLRQSLEWLSRASNWTKFNATAALGVIHKGHLSTSMSLLAPYLPQEGVSGSPFSEGGALYALGLIHANHGTSVIPTLTKALKSTQSEVLQHGAALGLGVAGMATQDGELYENLKAILYNDSAVAGEAAGIAMGLVMLGSGSEKALEEMLQYAHDTQHEKIIRGISLGMSMIMYGREETADTFIEKLCSDKDPIIRYGGVYTIAMAYAGTGDNKAIKKILHVAVSDVNDDVRRAAVTSLGFILFKTPEKVPTLVQLLSESYNPHVRYGATLALGIACAGTGLASALDILEPLTKDSVDYVRQGAFISLGMILVQHNEQSCPRSETTRILYAKVIADKREDMLARLGAALGQGIIDAGGRNVTISLKSRSGYNNIPAIVGMAVFTQFWYWFPLAHFLSLSFTPTGLIGLNKDLQAPVFEVVSNAKPSLYAYPPALQLPVVEVAEKVATAVLSTTVKSIARAKKAGKGEDSMEIDEKEPSPILKNEDKVKKKQVTYEILSNFTRVVPAQVKVVVMQDGRYTAIKKVKIKINKDLIGIVLLLDKKPGDMEELVDVQLGAAPALVDAPVASSEPS